jgi:tRNA A-37 threonylcarbamoyl transferase component Bud32/Tol biopolymer transport system component
VTLPTGRVAENFNRLSAALEGRYRLERELGQGGMATVYLAEDVKHKRRVAVKVLKPELAAVLGADRFVQEITTTAALQHPHILPLFDSGEAEGFLYYVMPFIDGETLRAKLDRETQLGVVESVRIATDVADALHYAHIHGIIHRDIKPENILLHDGRPMVADFGIALAVSAAAGGRMTETGLSLGTPHYMSPEQATAEKDITARSDVYSLASVLYEMLTGNPPHTGASAQQIIMKIITEQATPVASLRKSVPPNVAAAVAKALEKLPADRFATAKEFGDALTNASFATTSATYAPAGSRARTWSWGVALAAGLVLGATAGIVGTRRLAAPSAGGAELGREQLTFHGEGQRPAISPSGDYIAYVQVHCEQRHPAQCRSSLMLQETGATQPRALLTGALDLSAPRWTHDGAAVVVSGFLDASREGLFVVSRLSGTPQLIGPAGAFDTHARGDTVIVVSDRENAPPIGRIISVRNGAVLDTLSLPHAKAGLISWSPDGRHFAVLTRRTLKLLDRDGAITDSIGVSARTTIRWTPDGKGLLFFRVGAVKEDELVRLPVDASGKFDGAEEILMARVATLYLGEFDVARTSGQMVVATGDAITDLWSFDATARPVNTRRETSGTTWYGKPEIAHDGSLLYYYRGDALGDNVYVLDRTTRKETALTAQDLPGGHAVRLSSDGRRLAYVHSGDSIARLDVMELPSGRVSSAFVDIDGSTVVPVPPQGFLAQGNDGLLKAIDSLRGVWRVLRTPDSLLIQNFDVSPDGALAVFASQTYPAGKRVVVIAEVGLSRNVFRALAAFESDEPVPSLTWALDGTIYVGRWLATDALPSVWQLSRDDLRLVRVLDLPAACEARSIHVATDARTVVCGVNDFRSDIWLMDVPRVKR